MIWRPPGADYYGWLVGMQWPEGNEDKMWTLADDWKSAATQLNSIKEDIDAAMAAVRLAYPEGDGGDAMLAQLKSLKFGDLSKDGAGSIDSLVKWFDSIGALADNTGTEFEYSKLMFHAMLIIMAIDMAFAAASLFAAPAAEAAVIATNRITARMIMKQLVQKLLGQSVKFAEIAEIKAVLKDLAIKAGLTAAKSAALGAAMGTAPDAAIQAWQRFEGRREKFSWEQVGIMAAAGAAGGVVAAGVGGGLHGLFGTPSKITTRVLTTGVTMLAAGGSAGLAGWGASALITGNHEFDPRMITAGMWGGAAPGAIRAASPKGHAPTLAHPTAEFKSQPAPTKPSGIEAPATTSEGVPITPAHVSDGAGLSSDTPHAGDAEAGKQNPVVAAAAPQAPVNPVVHNDAPGGQVTNGQNAAPVQPAHQQPNSPGTTGPKLADGVQSSAASHAPGDVKPTGDGRPAPAAAPRAEPGSTTPADTSRAGAAPTREPAGTAAPVQAKTTGLEAGSRGNERLDAVPNDRAQVPASERLEGRIGGRHDDVTGGQHPNHDGTPARDEHRSGRTNDDVAQNERNPQRDNDPTQDGRPNRDGRSEHDRQPSRDGQPDHDGQPSRDGQPEHDSQPDHDPQPSHSEPPAPSHPAPHSVLPVDHPITAAERTHAADALAKLGHEVEALLHLDDVDQAGAHQKARDNHNWWHDLTPDEQGAVMRVHPHEIGNADGIPPHARDQANRLSIARDLTELRERNPRVDKWTSRWTDPEGRQQFKNLESTIHNLEHAETLADNFANRDRDDPPGHRPPVRVLSYDSKAFNGEGRAVVAIGDVDKASTVSWHIPGITTTVRSLEVNLNNAFHHYEATSDNVHDPGMVASIAWIGYDAPSGSRIGREMTNPALAQRGGQLLARDVAAFNQTRKINAGLPGGEPMPDVHLFGHSYGSTTTSYAGAGGRLTGEVSTITLLGSPGAGPVVHASEFGLGEGNVFVASSSRDPVTWIGSSTPGEIARAAPGLSMGLGMDPSVEAFGARRITAQFPGGAKTFSNIGTHTGYYKFHDDAHTVPSESLHNFAKIAAGDSGNVLPEFARPDHEGLNAWQRNIGSFPSDPAHLRPPIFDPHEGPPIGYEHLVEEFRNPDPTPDHPTLPADHQPVNDCGPQALRHAQELTGNENIRIPHDPDIAERGMSARDLEDAAGARMQLMDSPGVLADHLNRLGEGATAIVVAEFHGPTDINGIGAHAYTVTNDGGRLVVHDSALGTGPHPFSPNNPNVRSTHAVLFDSHGNPVHPIESGTPSHPNSARPEARIGQADPHGSQPAHEQPHQAPEHQKPGTPDESIRRFDSDEAGRKFGDEIMGSHMDSLSAAEREQVSRYTRHAWINELLRHEDPSARFATLAEDHATLQQLRELTGGSLQEPPLALLESADRHPSNSEPLQAALDRVLRDEYPEQRLREVWSDGQDFMEMRRILGEEPTAEVLNQHVQTLDRLTGQPTPEGFEVTRGMGSKAIDHLTIDELGTPLDGRNPRELINTLQTERGYLSTSLGEKPPSNFARSSIRVELDVPAGSKGLWIGGSEHEFLMQRGTRYLITDVIEKPPGSRYEGVEYLVKGIVVSHDYVHDPGARVNHPPAQEHPAPAVHDTTEPVDRPSTPHDDATPEHPEPHHVPTDDAPQRTKLPVEDKPYYANPHYEDPAASHEYAAENHINEREVQTTREYETPNHPEIARLTDAEISAIRRNQFMSLNEQVNDATRNGNHELLNDRDVEIRTLVSGYNKLPDHEGTVYRSLHIDDPVALKNFLDEYKYEPGKANIVPDRGFASSDKEASMRGGNIELVIDSHTGKDISWSNPAQEEVVFAPGTKFRVDDMRFNEEEGKYYFHLTDLGRIPDAHQPGGNEANSARSAGAHDEKRVGRPGDSGEGRPQHGSPRSDGGEGAPGGHRGPDQDLAGVGRIGDHPDQPGARRDDVAPTDTAEYHASEPSPEHPAEPRPEEPHDGPDQDHIPFTLGDEHPAAPVQVHDDRPASLTPHLQDRFNEMKSLATEIAKSLGEPARYSELPGLRDDFVKVLDQTGFFDHSALPTSWRLLTEHDPVFRDYLEKWGNDLIKLDPEPQTPNHQEPSSAHPSAENPQHPNSSHPQEDAAHPAHDNANPAAEPHPFPAKETEAGASFHPDDPAVADLASRIAKDPNHFTADVHITEDGHARIGDRTYTPEEFGNLLRQTTWDGRTPIRLIGCDAATNGFAARLAHHLGTDVLAPTKPAWSDHQGRVYTSTAETHPDGTRRPRIPPDGTWETFHPDGTRTKATEDGFAPGTRDEDKHILDPGDARDRAEAHLPETPERMDDFRELRDENRAKRIEGFEAVQDITHRNPSVDGVRRPSDRTLTTARYRSDSTRAPNDFFNFSGVTHDWNPASEAPARPPKGQRVFETSHASAFDPKTGRLSRGEGSDRANDSEPKLFEDVVRHQLAEHSGLSREVVDDVLAESIQEADSSARAEYAEVRDAWKKINQLLIEDNKQAAREAAQSGTPFTPRTIRDSTVHELVNDTGLSWDVVERVIEDSHEVHKSVMPDMQPGREAQELRTRARIDLAIEELNRRAGAEAAENGTPCTPFSLADVAGDLRMMIDLPSARRSDIPEEFQICDSCMNLIDVYQRLFPNMRVEALNLALERLYPL